MMAASRQAPHHSGEKSEKALKGHFIGQIGFYPNKCGRKQLLKK